MLWRLRINHRTRIGRRRRIDADFLADKYDGVPAGPQSASLSRPLHTGAGLTKVGEWITLLISDCQKFRPGCGLTTQEPGWIVPKGCMTMSKTPMTVADDVVVSLDYVLQLDDGQEIDRSTADEPLEYLHGHGQIVPGLENALYGLAVGDERQVVIEPAEGYGERNDEQLQRFPRDLFPGDVQLAEGEVLNLEDDQTGQVFQAQVMEVTPTEIVLDFNHPLAGETLHFDVRIAGLRRATAEELAHGHAH
jgi:FKBP-type peptidyl-prolyl cis-trans isomerase SlyD